MKWVLSTLLNTLKRFWLALFPLFWLYTLVDQQLTELIQTQLGSTEGTPKTVWLFVVTLMLFHMIFPLITQTFVFASVLNEPWLKLFKGKFSWAFKESLRSWGSVLLWSLAFVLPGFFRYCQLVFVNFVVMLNPNYEKGEVDALQASKKVFSKKWKSVVFYLFLFGAMIPVGLLPLESFSQIFKTPWIATLLSGLQLVLFVLSTLIFSFIYQNQQRGKNEPIF